MKTLKFFVVLCFIAAFAANNVNAQNRVLKQEVPIEIAGYIYCPCTGDYLYGTLIFDFITSSHNDISRLRDGILYGYDETGTIPSGNVYEVSQISPGTYTEESPTGYKWYENTTIYRLDGKIIALAHYNYHFVVNGKGEIILDRGEISKWNCK